MWQDEKKKKNIFICQDTERRILGKGKKCNCDWDLLLISLSYQLIRHFLVRMYRYKKHRHIYFLRLYTDKK